MENWVFGQRTTSLPLPNNYIFKEHPPFASMDKQGMNTTEFNGISDQQIPYSLQRLKINLKQSGRI
jgi:hypothetical protein